MAAPSGVGPGDDEDDILLAVGCAQNEPPSRPWLKVILPQRVSSWFHQRHAVTVVHHRHHRHDGVAGKKKTLPTTSDGVAWNGMALRAQDTLLLPITVQ